MPPEQIRSVATKFQRRIRVRNFIEYAAGFIVVPAFAWQTLNGPNPLYKVGAAMTVIGALVCLWQLHVRGGARRAPELSAVSLTDFHRSELVRQRDALGSVWLWYLGPFIPGLATCVTSFWLYPPVHNTLSPAERQANLIGFTAVVVAVLVGIFAVNRLGARRLQREIDKLDALTRG